MKTSQTRKTSTDSLEKLVLGALLTALVVILQMLGAFIRFGMFQVSLVLVPIVIGAAICGVKTGAWLGLVFGAVVLLNGDATVFLGLSVPGTVITVLLKGIACGLVAGLVYKALEKYNRYAAVIAAAVVCPIVNTGIFLGGCSVFFFNAINAWALEGGFDSALKYMFVGLAGGNFLFELLFNILLSPVIVKLINLQKKQVNQ